MGRRAHISVPDAKGLPHQWLSSTQAERVRLAREKFFEQGELPFGLVPNEVIYSWRRCQRAGVGPDRKPNFDPIPRARVDELLHRREPLMKASCDEFDTLTRTFAATGCRIALMDQTPTMLRISPPSHGDGPMLRISARPGVRFDELSVGTGASNLAAGSGQLHIVDTGEHYWSSMLSIRCVAAPIQGPDKRVAGVLCLISEGRSMDFDPLPFIGPSVTIIENKLLAQTAGAAVLIAFHAQAVCVGTPWEALVAIDGRGRILGMNTVASRLLSDVDPSVDAAPMLMDSDPERLLRTAQRIPQPVRLINGLSVWACARMLDMNNHGSLPAPYRPSCQKGIVGRWEDELVHSELLRQGGNISAAARELGVSRNYLYRRLRTQERGVVRGGDEQATECR